MRDEPARLLIDVDMGVDDAVAVGWLLAQTRYPVSVLGITTVAGNTTVENATRNVSALLQAADVSDLPVIQGAAAPLRQPLSETASGMHGPDGLWFAASDFEYETSPRDDAPAFIAEHAAPDVTLIALGPLTNLAHALRLYPDEMNALKEIVILGGARCGGNRTPVAEFNIWADPEAAAQVLAAQIPITLIPLDVFAQFTVSLEDVATFADSANPVARFLAAPLERYGRIQAGFGEAGQIPDFTAVLYTLDRSLGQKTPALVQVVPAISEEGPARILRGQTIVGLTPDEKVVMLAGDRELSRLARKTVTEPAIDIQAEMEAILARAKNEVQVVIEIEVERMRERLLSALIA